jgi:DNA-binding MarR family transcriptional regulator
MTSDPVDRVVEGWGRVRPELDTTPMAVMGRVHRLSRVVAERVEEHFASAGVSRGDYDVLASLRRAGDPPRLAPGDLVGALLLSSAGVTGRVDRLERRGLVRRLPNPDDGRGVLVELTPAGRELVDRLVREDMERQAPWMATLSDRERAQLTRLLAKLLRGVEDDVAR